MIERREFLKQGAAAIALTGAASTFGTRALAAALKARGVFAAPGMSFAALYNANQMGLWAKSGADAELKWVRGGPLCIAALANHEADFACTASTDPIISTDKGIKTLVVAAFTGSLFMQYTARNDWMKRAGITPDAPLEARLKAFRGARIGVSTVGGGPAQYTRYLAHTVGLDPDKDMKLLAVGFGAPRMAALRTNQVDITVGDAPEADQVAIEGFGKLYVNCGQDVPIFREFAYTVASVTPEFADKRPDVIRAVGHAIGAGNDAFKTNFGQVVDAMRKIYDKFDPKAVERALERDKASFPAGARMTETMWKNNIDVSRAIKMIASAPSAKEGVLWTNKYLS